MKIIIVEDYAKLGEKAAEIVAEQVSKNPDSVLGLATGTTVISTYKKLAELYNKSEADFSHVKTFNLDEYWPIKKTDVQSYRFFMKYMLFDHINVKPNNIHIPDGELKKEQIKSFCENYENKITEAGGIDLQILGIGGGYFDKKRQFIGAHIGFNESGSDFDSRTRLIELSEQTRTDNSRFFRHLENVPHYAITMGLKTITKAKHIILLAYGDNKSSSIKQALEEPITNLVPASILQQHPNLTVIVDKSAGSKLKEVAAPWLVKHLDWKQELRSFTHRKENFLVDAVIWLSKKTRNPIRNLTLKDYINNNLDDLAKIYKNQVDLIANQVTERLESRIVAPKEILSNKKIVVLSPHPDDDVISVGGTITHLKEKQNEVKIIYMVSGNIAVRDKDVLCYLAKQSNEKDSIKSAINSGTIEQKKLFELKTKVREFEAKQATKILGVPTEDLVFLHSPFYETGLIIKNEITASDWKPLTKILEKEKPDIIMVPGESADPHGTHGKCIEIFRTALNHANVGSLELWHYRGGWEEYTVSEANKIVPFSERIMEKKIEAIKQHVSQLNPVFGGLDPRPFWKRAKDRNMHSGKTLEILGLSSKPYAELFLVETA